jgi:hypothetical protein
MADKIRNNTFLIKRSNVPGKVPAAGSVLLGELALNTADVILYASGTTANSILPIGWDRVARTGDTMTGGLFTPFLSATTISAETITLKNYIDFNTGTTAPSNVSGRVFYDNQSHSLAYYPDITQNVRVEMGQQLYIRGFNNTGSIIPKGTALSIQSATNGLPNFTPALISHRGFSQVVGLAASDIPINGNGLALSQGILSGLTVNTFNVGDIIYASPFSAGTYVATTSNFPFSARTNQIGFVIATGTTNGQIYVSINNEDENLTLTDIERNILEGNVASTGVYEFTGLTVASATTINIAPVRGWIVKNTYDYATLPDVTNIYYTGGTNIPVTNISTADSTFILLTSASTIVQQTTFPTPQQRRENIFLGKVVHPSRTTIQNVNNTVDFDVSPMSALRDLWTPLKLINQGVIVSANGANLNINTSNGTLWGNGIGWITNQLNPDSVSISGTSPTTFQYRVQTGGTFSNTTTIDVANYDLNGVITPVGGGAGSSTNQRVYLYPTGVIRIQYGQTVHASLAAAVTAVQTETFVEYSNNRDNAILIGVISVNKSATQLNNTSQAVFSFVSKFGEVLGGTGGLSTTTLQQAYDNSSTPEIVINSTLDGLSIKNGTGNVDNVTRVLEAMNATNNVTSFIRADGYISGTTFQSNGFIGNNGGATATTLNILTLGSGTSISNLGIDVNGRVVSGTTGGAGSTFTGGTVNGATIFTNGLSANTISATTYYNLPTDIRVTGASYSNNTFTYTNNTGGTFSTLFNTVTGLTINGNLSISGSSLPSGYALSLTGDTNFVGDVYVSGDLTYNGNLLVTGGTIIQSGLTANTIYTDYIDFNTGATVTGQVGRLRWNDADEIGGLEVTMKGGNVTLQIGEENLARVYNDDNITLTDGMVVYVYGNQGNTISVRRASATGETTSAKVLGVVTETIPVGGRGFVNTFGLVRDLDTSAYSGGTALWLGTTPGTFTDVKPHAPNHLVLIGFVSRSHASTGSIFIHISNGWEIDELHDVLITNKSFGDILTLSGYNGNDIWVNSKTLNGSYTITGNTTIGGNLLASTMSANTITGTTLYGDGSNITNIQISNVTNLQTSLDNKFDKSGGTVTGSVLITGDVTVLGTATTINTQTLTVKDNIITINSNYSGNTAPYPSTSGIEVLRGSATTATLLWDETTQKWVAGLSGNTKQIILSGDSLSLLNSGHTHPISEVINLQSSLDNKFDKSGGTVTGGIITNSLSATTITGTTLYGNGTNLTGVVKGSGASGYLSKWTGTTGLSNSIIQDNGTNVGVGTSPALYTKLNIVTTAGNTESAITALNYNIGASGVKGISIANGSAGTIYGVFGEAYDAGTTNIGVYGYAHIQDFSATNAIGGKFQADSATNNYSVQLIDGTEGVNKVLISNTSDGKANWSSVLSGLTNIYTNTISATTYQNLPTDIRVTGASYSNNTFTYTNNTGGTFNVLFNTMTGLTVNGTLSATTIYSNSIGVKTTSPTFDLEVNGTFGATSKSFVIKHPTQEGKKLVYGAIEGPEFGVYVRGKVNGNIIELPEEWIGLVDENSITVQLTGDGILKLLYVNKIKDNKVYVSNIIPFIKPTGYYTVYGERKDIDKIKTII